MRHSMTQAEFKEINGEPIIKEYARKTAELGEIVAPIIYEHLDGEDHSAAAVHAVLTNMLGRVIREISHTSFTKREILERTIRMLQQIVNHP